MAELSKEEDILAAVVSDVKEVIVRVGMRRSWTAEQVARNNVSHFVKAFIMFLGSPYWATCNLLCSTCQCRSTEQYVEISLQSWKCFWTPN